MGRRYFKRKYIHEYTRVARGKYGNEVMSTIDFVLVKNLSAAVRKIKLVGINKRKEVNGAGISESFEGR